MSKPAIPPKVAAAIVAVMSDMKRIEKGDHNKHGGYDFTSVDDFLDATRPACAAAGLIIVPDEDSIDMVDKWLRVKFSFTVAHSSGETWDHQPTRTVMVNSAMGSQAYGAAQSYAMKQFLRALFQIATGDGEDAETQPNEQLPAQRRGPPPAPKPAARPDVNEDAMAYAAYAETELMNADSAADLKVWWNSDDQKQKRRDAMLPADMLEALKTKIVLRIAELDQLGIVRGPRDPL